MKMVGLGITIGRVDHLLKKVWNIMYYPPGMKGKNKFEARWQEGVWLGIADRSMEVIVGTNDGVIKVRCEKIWHSAGAVGHG